MKPRTSTGSTTTHSSSNCKNRRGGCWTNAFASYGFDLENGNRHMHRSEMPSQKNMPMTDLLRPECRVRIRKQPGERAGQRSRSGKCRVRSSSSIITQPTSEELKPERRTIDGNEHELIIVDPTQLKPFKPPHPHPIYGRASKPATSPSRFVNRLGGYTR